MKSLKSPSLPIILDPDPDFTRPRETRLHAPLQPTSWMYTDINTGIGSTVGRLVTRDTRCSAEGAVAELL